jgi:hypothetical protein
MSLHSPKQQGNVCAEWVCMLQTNVSCVSGVLEVCCKYLYWCCKNRSGCCTCCNGYKCMFQVYVSNVSFVLDVCCKCFHLNVAKLDLDVAYTYILQAYVLSVLYSIASVSFGCYICLQWISSVFQVLILNVYCKCFSCFWTYVASVSLRCYK